MDEEQIKALLATVLEENNKTVLESVAKMVNKSAANSKRDLTHFKTELETIKTTLKPKESEESETDESKAESQIVEEPKSEPKSSTAIDLQTDALWAQSRAVAKELAARKD